MHQVSVSIPSHLVPCSVSTSQISCEFPSPYLRPPFKGVMPCQLTVTTHIVTHEKTVE
jgi:hypothetical protein